MATQPPVTVSGLRLETFRLPKLLRDAARKKARACNLTFSELMCRALCNELGILIPQQSFAPCKTERTGN